MGREKSRRGREKSLLVVKSRYARDAPGTPGDLMGPLMGHKNGRISTNIQRQKLSVAVFEAACQGPSHEALDHAVCCIKREPKSKKTHPRHQDIPEPGTARALSMRRAYI